jgi:hypothetical protein
MEVSYIRLGLSVETVKVRNFAVIEKFCNNGYNVICSKTGSDVLTVATTIGSYVIGISASRGDLSGSRYKSIILDKIAR